MSEYENLFAEGTGTPEAERDDEPSVEYPVVRGGLWGLSLGFGLAIYALIFRVIELRLTTVLLIVLAGVVVGLLWSRFGPVKR